MAFIYTDGAMTPVTRPSAPTNLSFDKNDVAPEEEVKLSWDASVDGICNPVNRYEVYAGNELWGWSTETQLQFLAHKDVKSLDYWVKAVGKIESMSSLDSEHISLTVIITAPSAPKNVSISNADAAILSWQTVSWDASSDGTNNSVTGYEVYRNGELIATTDDTSVWVQASNVDGGKYSYTVRAIGSVTGYHSDESEAVTLTAHAATYADYYFTVDTKDKAMIIPDDVERVDICCIGGGAGGRSGGVTYNGTADVGEIYKVYPAGGGGGATGYIVNEKDVNVERNVTYTITVGEAGAAWGGKGGTSSFGSLVSAEGGNAGDAGDNEPLNYITTANGGRGGDGGVGGNGGGRGRGTYSEYVGVDGLDGNDNLDWKNWGTNEWYVFEDVNTKRRLGQGGRGGDGLDTNQYSNRAPRGLAVGPSDECYGGGGRGGDQQRTGSVYAPGAGQPGLVAVRCWRYVR